MSTKWALPFSSGSSMIGGDSTACVTTLSWFLDVRVRFDSLRYLFVLAYRRSGAIQSLTLPFCVGFSENGYDSITYVTLLF